MKDLIKYLRAFVIGSCAFATMPWMWSQSFLRKKEHTVNYDYYNFSLYLPLRRGLWNVFSLIIAEYFGLSLRMRFIVITFIDWIVTIITVKYLNKYLYNDKEWMDYYCNLFIKYFIYWNIVIYNVEKYI